MKTNKKNDTHPLAINILKLQRYNYDFFNCEEVVFFEYIVVKGLAFKKNIEFYHSSETIRKETGIKKHSLGTIIKRFTSLGLLSIAVKGMPNVKYFQVHYPQIMELLPTIYKMSENGQLYHDFSKHLYDFYLPLVDNYLEKNINKNNIEEINKEKKDNESEDRVAVTFFYDFIATLRYEKKIPPASLTFNEAHFYRALEKYELETLCEFVKIYFTDTSSPTLKKFFVFDSIAPNRLKFIEQKTADELNYATAFINTLQESYASRVQMHNENPSNKRGKSESKLVVTARIIEKALQALRVKSELEINNAFMPYIDAILKEDLQIKKILPYFFALKDGEYEIIDTYLEYYNIKYGYTKKNNY